MLLDLIEMLVCSVDLTGAYCQPNTKGAGLFTYMYIEGTRHTVLHNYHLFSHGKIKLTEYK
jgi:hypothetical protein